MNAIGQLIELIRDMYQIPSDKLLSQRIGVTRAALSAWRNGVKPVPEERIVQLCKMGKFDAAEWMMKIKTEQAKNLDERKVWQSALNRVMASPEIK